ncbi:hypothetical protein [Rufibacter quisquiliarum]|uniref:REP element-mobilizing transposase RayT n=1 Tax=Rufibacter quisquiliarum TaxID=1549639 RepID=A0A839GL80_9BACT|nr:hypothetical protein [Rufibacter quisquiliarum]MBA9079602.1 REP element-mobilizing transposase RayT [Rufibacter quisquiliarum]
MQKSVPLEAGKFYHVYTRGNNKETVFISKENYNYFLQLYRKYLTPYVHTYAYCLLPNHFHLLVQVKEEEALRWKSADGQMEEKLVNISQQFSHLLNAYTKAFNAVNKRVGSLFQNRFGRKEVTSEAYFTRLVYYLHFNPQHHGIVEDFQEWPYSSYYSLLSLKKTNLLREEVLQWFGGKDWFKSIHLENAADFNFITPLLEDDL